MKTNNLSKKSFLTTMILALSAGFNKLTQGGTGGNVGLANGYTGGGSPMFIPRRGKFKGYMRKTNRRER